MCGIVGAFGIPDGSSWVREEIERLRFRGPDFQDVKILTNDLCMGVARLSMTDPHPRSNQPMIDLESGSALSFNGEIYNFNLIRRSLAEEGVEFFTESDTEVLLKFLTRRGIENLNMFNGMFAFAFFSRPSKKLFLARDRLGKKPLYYRRELLGIRWSSSIDSLRRKNQSRDFSDLALIQYLSLGYLLDPTTTDDEILSLQPGEVLEFDLNFKNPLLHHEISPTLSLPYDGSNLRNLVGESVNDRIVGHEKVAVSLSGGVDSSVIAIELSDQVASATAFTARWSDSDKNRYNIDADLAESIASKLGLNFQEVEMIKAKELPAELEKFLMALEEPNNNPSGVSMMRLYESIALSGHRLALTGDGSDEIFAGYARYSASSKIRNLLHLKGDKVGSRAFADVNRPRALAHKAIASQRSINSPLSWLQWHWVFTPPESLRVLSIQSNQQSFIRQVNKSVDTLVKFDKPISNPQALMERDHKIWLAMESNRKLDRISMCYSIEARSPFQDDRVIDWAQNFMLDNKYRTLSKVPLWGAYPELLKLGARRDKAGFTSPVGHWLRSNPELVSKSISYLKSDRRFCSTGLNFYLDVPSRGQYRELMQLWTLVVLSTWMQLDSK